MQVEFQNDSVFTEWIQQATVSDFLLHLNIYGYFLQYIFHEEKTTCVSQECDWSFISHIAFIQVEIVMGLEEEFGISVEEESAQTIATVQDAADLIEKLVEKKST